jgi:hypothetical protein
MFRFLFKKILALLHPFAPHVFAKHRSKLPFLCIITPIFDDALPSLKPLIQDLQKQSFGNFIHVLVSNGESRKVKKYLTSLSRIDNRFIYTEIPAGKTDTWQKLQVNLGKRKNFALQKYDAERYVFIDADSAITDAYFIAKLCLAHYYVKKDILVVRINHKDKTLPIFPVRMGTLDMCNYTISRNLAKHSHYPTDPWQYFSATDFLYFRDINRTDNTSFLPFTYLKKDARRSYQSVGEKIYGNRL